jgi:type IV secretory pathway VirB2 component (pilin)
MTTSKNSAAQSAEQYAETVAKDATALAAKAKTDVASAEAAVVKADNWLVTFITGNAKKIAAGVLIAAGLLVWHFI